MRFRELQGFDIVVQGDGQHLGFARDIAADHQYHAEFTHRVGKTQARRGNETASGQGQHDRAELVQWAGAQGGGRLQQTVGYPLERGLQGLHDKRQGIDYRADHKRAETECQLGAGQPLPGGPQRGSGGKQQQQVEAQNGGRENQWHCHDGLDQSWPVRFLTRQPPRQRRAQDQ